MQVTEHRTQNLLLLFSPPKALCPPRDLLGLVCTEPHSLDILITGLNEPGGTHGFFMLAKLDGLELASYSSASREVKPLQEWTAQAVGASYLRKKTQEFRLYEAISPVVTHRWMAQHNQTGGIHTLQLHVNCVLDGDTPVRGQFHFGFDGQDFLILERNQSAWVPLVPGASNEAHFWDAGHTWTLFAREFLQEECVDTLRSLLRGGREALGRQVPPGISVTYRDAPHGSATLSCHARGFYPRPIRVSWVRDGAEILPPTNASGILPHADGTYQIRQSLEIPPQWGHSYACRVAHSSLGEPAPTTALPEVSVSRRDAPDGSATLSCRARGFDPRPVRVSWVRDGKETLAPPIGDASQLQSSVGIPQQAGDGHSYSCRVQHRSLQEALATPAPGEMGGLAPGILAVLCLAVLTVASAMVAGVVVWRRKRLGKESDHVRVPAHLAKAGAELLLPQEFTGVPPSEVLSGRRVRGPLDWMRDEWDGKINGKWVVEYELWGELMGLARENPARAQETQKS
ncbi:class I histocompatibility antigen, F10 alpha chain-like [Mauremys mutica]|uniref:class I histocompatibility antigen, F10 alpha chain-like n=1 Tax=Mauremys mutica TaxID=74926 RepID=UPI001D168202|nr:class I histocompatibility antigen, F10 alpha chain-like [Mauremys mutica]